MLLNVHHGNSKLVNVTEIRTFTGLRCSWAANIPPSTKRARKLSVASQHALTPSSRIRALCCCCCLDPIWLPGLHTAPPCCGSTNWCEWRQLCTRRWRCWTIVTTIGTITTTLTTVAIMEAMEKDGEKIKIIRVMTITTTVMIKMT